jgi:hypothetical protein
MIEFVGWFGAALVLVSYAQRNTIRLRQISLLAGRRFSHPATRHPDRPQRHVQAGRAAAGTKSPTTSPQEELT